MNILDLIDNAVADHRDSGEQQLRPVVHAMLKTLAEGFGYVLVASDKASEARRHRLHAMHTAYRRKTRNRNRRR